MRAVAVTLACLLPGCFGLSDLGGGFAGSPCGPTLHAEWHEPGLHAALARAQETEGVLLTRLDPPRPLVPNATLEALWGPVGLVEVAYRPAMGGKRMDEATVSHTTWGGEGTLQLGVSVDASRGLEDAERLARTLLERLELPQAQRDAILGHLRQVWRPDPPVVANHAASVPFEHDLDWSRVPALLFPNGTWDGTIAGGDVRHVRQGPWSLGVKVGGVAADTTLEGHRVRVEAAPDDRVRAYVGMAEGEPSSAAFARVNATLARLGVANATFSGYEGAAAIC